MEPYLSHGIRDCSLDKLICILRTGYILPRKDIGEMYRTKKEEEVDFNGEEYISLAQKSLFDESVEHVKNSSFYRFVFRNLCIIIENDYKNLEYTNYVNFDLYDSSFFKRITGDNLVRYSQFVDEVQTKEKIPTSKFIAIGYPKKTFMNYRNVNSEIDKIKKTLKDIELDIPIIDSSYLDFADDEEKIKKYTIK